MPTISTCATSDAYNVGMRTRDLPPLGDFEQLVLLAILRVGGDAYGGSILKELQCRAGRSVSRGALYVTLDRLESKGYVSSRTGDPAPARGGRPRRYYTVRASGLALLRHSLDALRRMSEGLALELKHP
jgi:PadR family transcriptional regulator PadR